MSLVTKLLPNLNSDSLSNPGACLSAEHHLDSACFKHREQLCNKNKSLEKTGDCSPYPSSSFSLEQKQPTARISKRTSYNPLQPCIYDSGPAASFRELVSAYRLVYQRYTQAGYMAEDSVGLRFSLYNLLPQTQCYVTRDENKIVSTASLVIDSAAGIPADCVFEDEINLLRLEGRKVAEGTMFSASAQLGLQAIAVQNDICCWIIAQCIAANVDDLCIVVNPRHVTSWERVLGFTRLGQPRSCNHVEGNSGILLRLNISKWLSGEITGANLLDEHFPRILSRVARAGQSCPLSNQQLIALLRRRPEILAAATSNQEVLLGHYYPNSGLNL